MSQMCQWFDREGKGIKLGTYILTAATKIKDVRVISKCFKNYLFI